MCWVRVAARALAASVLSLMAVPCLLAGAAAGQGHLYVGDCTGLRVYSLPGGEPQGRVDLARTVPALRAFPAGAAGCPLVDLALAPGGRGLLAIVQPSPAAGGQDQLLRLGLPGFAAQGAVPLGEGDASFAPDAGSAVTVLRGDGQRVAVADGKLAPAPPPEDLLAGLPVSAHAAGGPQVAPVLDLSGWQGVSPELRGMTEGGKGQSVAVLPVARSGDVALLLVAAAPPLRVVLLLADAAQKRVMLLEPGAASAETVHLAPGGGGVLVEEIAPTAGPLGPRRTGKVLFTAGAGAVQRFTVPRTAHFLTILPDGQALFVQGKTLIRLRLAKAFAPVPVRGDRQGAPAVPFVVAPAR